MSYTPKKRWVKTQYGLFLDDWKKSASEKDKNKAVRNLIYGTYEKRADKLMVEAVKEGPMT